MVSVSRLTQTVGSWLMVMLLRQHGEDVDVPVSQSVEQTVDHRMPQVEIDTVVEQIVDVQVLLFQKESLSRLDFTVVALRRDS